MKPSYRPVAVGLALSCLGSPAQAQIRPEIIRTEHGVPHIYATDYRQAGYGLAWVELEDYGPRVVNAVISGRGEMGAVYGPDSLEQDFARRPIHAHAKQMWPRLELSTRQMYDGFAAAINDYVTQHPTEFVARVKPVFAGWDVLAREIAAPNLAGARRLLNGKRNGPASRNNDEGSNAWALAPPRTASGHAILLRNPHLNWDAGYYEAHLVIDGQIDFYGDFRIGGAFAVVGGFNRHLGWATTNNNVDSDELYEIPLARGRDDRIMIDGRPVPLIKKTVVIGTATRESWTSPFGPVIDRRNGRAYILRTAGEGEWRGGEQFLKMMRATSLAEWETAMKIRARTTSNLTYADRAGNILYVWNGALPALPHPPGGDSVIVPASSSRGMFSHLVPWDSMPMVKNPATGYVHNENDSPHFANLEAPLNPARLPRNVEAPSLRLRSQHALDLLRYPEDKFSLEDIVATKHSYRMLLAERMVPDLLLAAESVLPAPSAEVIAVLRSWDRSAAPQSRGGVLFEQWWREYTAHTTQPFTVPWSIAEPITSPRGLANPSVAIASLTIAADSVRRRYGRLDVSWGEVHRIRLGGRDIPVGGCAGDLGCFRVLTFRDEPDLKQTATGGDSWILAVEFGEVPKAYSVLAYGQSNRVDSPFFADQADRFAVGDLKPVAFTRIDVERTAVRRYRAGESK